MPPCTIGNNDRPRTTSGGKGSEARCGPRIGADSTAAEGVVIMRVDRGKAKAIVEAQAKSDRPSLVSP
jgi:hypothetical protein